MSKNLLFFGFFFFCLAAAALPAYGRKEKTETKIIDAQKIELDKNAVENAEKAKTKEDSSKTGLPALIQVTGIVRLIGGGPAPQIVITMPDIDWYISREDEHLFKELQRQTVTVEGSETVVELKFANGLSAGQRRTLKDVKIISIFSP